jgi:hypothetical protein
MADYKFSGDILDALCKDAGKSYADLGADVGRSESCIKLYRYEHRSPPMDMVLRLAAALGVPVETFFVAADDPEPVLS